MKNSLPATFLALSACVHTPGVSSPANGAGGNPGEILTELFTTTAQIEALAAQNAFANNPSTAATTDRIATLPNPEDGMLSLSGYPHLGDAAQPGCILTVDERHSSAAFPGAPDARLAVNYNPPNTVQNLLIVREGPKSEFIDAVNCAETKGATTCTYVQDNARQEVSSVLTTVLLKKADDICTAFRAAQ